MKGRWIESHDMQGMCLACLVWLQLRSCLCIFPHHVKFFESNLMYETVKPRSTKGVELRIKPFIWSSNYVEIAKYHPISRFFPFNCHYSSHKAFLSVGAWGPQMLERIVYSLTPTHLPIIIKNHFLSPPFFF